MTDPLIRSSKIAQWGNGAAIRIGTAALERAHLHVNDPVDVIANDEEIVIRRQRPRVTMAELLDQFDPDRHRHDLAFDIEPAGIETH